VDKGARLVEIKSQLKLERFITVDPQSLERFEREGRRLGQMGQPASNATELCKVESDEINSVSIAWNNYQNEVSKNTERLKNLIDDAKNIIENVLPAKNGCIRLRGNCRGT